VYELSKYKTRLDAVINTDQRVTKTIWWVYLFLLEIIWLYNYK